jgi:hypothetical protein
MPFQMYDRMRQSKFFAFTESCNRSRKLALITETHDYSFFLQKETWKQICLMPNDVALVSSLIRRRVKSSTKKLPSKKMFARNF